MMDLSSLERVGLLMRPATLASVLRVPCSLLRALVTASREPALAEAE